jgi:lipopolysaccharide transport system permease protein
MQKTVIENRGAVLSAFNFKELIRYRDLFRTLSYREFKVRYAQTALGFFWSFLQPLATLLIFIVIFGRAIKVDTGGIPYPVFVLSGMSAWMYFSFVVTTAGKSLINDQSMIQKIYFPRLIIPLSKAAVGLIDFGISFLLMLIALLYYGVYPSENIVWLPLFILLSIFASITIGIWISALTVRYRDIQHVIPFIVQIGLYATPVAYPVSYIPEKFIVIYYLCNPMAGVIEGFRWSIIGTGQPEFYMFYSFGLIILLFFLGIMYFSKVEKTMADYI